MRVSDKLYSINAEISLQYIGLNVTPTRDAMVRLNAVLGQIIKEVRELEEQSPLNLVSKENKEEYR